MHQGRRHLLATPAATEATQHSRGRHLLETSKEPAPKCRFTFTRVREEKDQCAFGCCKCVQVAEIEVYGSDPAGHSVRLNVSAVANPSGLSPVGPRGHGTVDGPGGAVDGLRSTKWIDMAFPKGFAPGPHGYSVLEIELEDAPLDSPLSSYAVISGNDAEWRDPLGWTVRCWTYGGLELADVRELAAGDAAADNAAMDDQSSPAADHIVPPAVAPTSRLTRFGFFPLVPLAPPSPPTEPHQPPASPPPPAESGELRLSGGASPSEGQLQIFHEGAWGTVCDDRFSLVDARVACRQLGWPAGAEALVPLADVLPHGNGDVVLSDEVAQLGGTLTSRGVRVWMDGLKCLGDEARLDACSFGGWGVENCVHAEDVALRCNASHGGGGGGGALSSGSAQRSSIDAARFELSFSRKLPPPPAPPLENDDAICAADTLGEDARSAACVRWALAILALPSVALLLAAAAATRAARAEFDDGSSWSGSKPSDSQGLQPTFGVRALGARQEEEGAEMMLWGGQRSDDRRHL